MSDKIKILFLAANPKDVESRLELDREIKEIGSKIRKGSQRDSFELVSEWCVMPEDLQEALLRHQPHILHFSGHGSKTDGIALEHDSGNTVLLGKGSFTRLLKLLKDNLRIVVLNACYTKEQAEALKETIDYTIGMNDLVFDESARVFAAHFYQALAFGRPVPNAFELALNQLDLEKMEGSNIPELVIGKGVDPSQPFSINGKARKEEPQKSKGSDITVNHSDGGAVYNTGGTVTVGRDQIGQQVRYHDKSSKEKD